MLRDVTLPFGPQKVRDIYLRAVDRLGGDELPLHGGPSHVVWGDDNFDCAEWCLEHFDEFKEGRTEHELAVIRQSLEELAAIPMDERFVEDGEDED